MLAENSCPWPQTLTLNSFSARYQLHSDSFPLIFFQVLTKRSFLLAQATIFPASQSWWEGVWLQYFLTETALLDLQGPREKLHLTRAVSLIDRVYNQNCEFSHAEHGTYPTGFSLRSLVRDLSTQCTVSPISPWNRVAQNLLRSSNWYRIMDLEGWGQQDCQGFKGAIGDTFLSSSHALYPFLSTCMK